MGKKRFHTKSKSKQKVTREEDATYRLTHLWCAAHLLSKGSPTLSQFYVGTSRQIGRRVNLILDSVTVKRQLCKKCNNLLVPGLGRYPPRVRHVKQRNGCLVISCGFCNEARRFASGDSGRACDAVRQVVNVDEQGTGGEKSVAATRTCQVQ